MFPKYIKHLKNYEDARLIYVTPSSIIKEELDMFKEYFIDKEGTSTKKCLIDCMFFQLKNLNQT